MSAQKIKYGTAPSPLGEMVIATTDRGVCWLGFMVDGYKGNGEERLHKFFPKAQMERDDEAMRDIAAEMINAWEEGREQSVALDLHGTEFQKLVWRSLLHIRRGHVMTYGAIANDIGKPKAARAVGSAVGENPVSLIVPCHRVVQQSGAIGNYGWGVDLKRRILNAEGLQI